MKSDATSKIREASHAGSWYIGDGTFITLILR
mgnify:CR=1 FL=1